MRAAQEAGRASEARTARRRLLALGALAAVIGALVVALVSGDSYRVTATFQNAGQIVTGNEVRVGGVTAGSVKEISLDEHSQAELVLELEERFSPLHEGTRATIQVPGLAGIAGRYVTLEPGPDNAPEIPDGGTISVDETEAPVDADQVLNALDPRTVSELQDVIAASARGLAGRGDETADAIDALYPALSQASLTLAEVLRDDDAVERLVAETADVVDALAERRDDLAAGTVAAEAATGALARQREALARSLALAPPTLRQANTTLADLRLLLTDLRPAIAEGRPAAERIAALLPRLRPFSARLRRELPPLRTLLRRELSDLLEQLPGLARAGRPVLRDLTSTLDDAQPIVDEARPYVPELTSGLIAGFGGSVSGYYDANGQYVRIGLINSPFSLAGPLTLGESLGLEQGVVKRCPGGAIYPAPDRSNPFTDKGQLHCDPGLAGSAP